MDYKKIDNVCMEGIDTTDYPDFCDAFVFSADYDGKQMTDKQLDEINSDSCFIQEEVHNHLM